MAILLIIFPAFMAYAGCSDLLTMRIANRVVLAMVIAFFIIGSLAGLTPQQFITHAGLALVVLIVTFTMFALGWIGGGDAKFTAATVLWLGPEIILEYLLVATVLGGFLTFAILVFRRYVLPPQLISVAWIERLHNKSSGVPYGIALAAAGLVVYSKSPVFLHFMG